MAKVCTYTLSFILFISLVTCSMTLTQQTPSVYREKAVVTPPTTNVPLPKVDYMFTPLMPKLKKTTYAHKNITENFSDREKQHIAVQDPKLMADGNSLIIDLSQITEEDYVFPLPGAKLISPYAGRRRHHSGVDLKTCPRDTIVAAFDGIVRMAKPYAAYGNVVVIRHYNGLETVYSHNSKNLVKVGKRVKAGDPVALTGRTGRATTEHLHFEVRVNGQHFNPDKVFDMTTRKLRNSCLVATKSGGKISVKAIAPLPFEQEGKSTK